MGNDQKYSNSMIQTQFSQQSQYSQASQEHPYNTHMQSTQMNQSPYTNYSLGNQMDQGYQQISLQQQQQQQYQTQQQQYQQQMATMQQNYGSDSNQYQSSQMAQDGPGPANLRRNSRLNESTRPPNLGASFSQSSIDHFDHYKRPPSRDSSVDRYARATSRLSGSRQPSVDRTILSPSNNLPAQTDTIDRSVRAGSAFRNVPQASTVTTKTTGNGSIPTGSGKPSPRASLQTASQAIYSTPNQPFEDVLLRQRNLGQDIIPSPREPKRTESLYTTQKPVPSGNTAGAAAFLKSGKLKVNYF